LFNIFSKNYKFWFIGELDYWGLPLFEKSGAKTFCRASQTNSAQIVPRAKHNHQGTQDWIK
jgi:hypothetical protein